MSGQKRFFSSHVKSGALLITLIAHAVFLAIAVVFVAIKVVVDNPPNFMQANVDRPHLPIRKIIVPVRNTKMSRSPKITNPITAVTKKPLVEFRMPVVTGFRGNGDYGTADSLQIGLNLDSTIFGDGMNSGNEFEGTFYDLKQTPEGESTDIGKLAERDTFNADAKNRCVEVLNAFVRSGWNINRLEDYFKAPRHKYATAFMMPPMTASAAPEAFGVADQVNPSYWVCHYKGQIAAPETGRYRFCGLGDDVLLVRVGKKLMLDACWKEWDGRITNWESDDDNNRKFPLNQTSFPDGYMSEHSRMVIGDWFTLKKGQRVDVEVLIGEIPGGSFTCRLMIEQEGVDYATAASDVGPRPVLPVFKTTGIGDELAQNMSIEPNETTFTGPSFGVLVNGN